MNALKKNDSGSRVKALQQALQALGFAEIKADGALGPKTLTAVEAFADGLEGDDEIDSTPNDTVPLDLEAQILAAKPAVVAVPKNTDVVELGPSFIDARRHYAGTSYPTRNPWAKIDTICLHQMAVDAGSDWSRWKRLAIHVVVPRKGVTALTNSIDRKVPHGHGWNSRSVGFEVEGHFAGVRGKDSTHWTPEGAKGSRLIPQEITESQVAGALAAIDWCVAEVAKNGGQIKFVGSHRPAYGRKSSDPGQAIWEKIALVAMKKHGLTTAPTLSHHKYPGKPIPAEWDPAQVGVKY